MLVVEIDFGHDRGKSGAREALSDAAEGYVSTLLRNGQIHGDYLLTWSQGGLICLTRVERRNAMQKRCHSTWGLKERAQVLEVFGRLPTVRIVTDDVPKSFPSWRKASSFYLFTHVLDVGSPVHDGNTDLRVPGYELAISDKDRDGGLAFTSFISGVRDVDSSRIRPTRLKMRGMPESESTRDTGLIWSLTG